MANLDSEFSFDNVNRGNINSDNEEKEEKEDIYSTPTRSTFVRKLELSTLKSAGPKTIDSVRNNSFFKHCYRLMCSILSEEDNDIEVSKSELTPTSLMISLIASVLTFKFYPFHTKI